MTEVVMHFNGRRLFPKDDYRSDLLDQTKHIKDDVQRRATTNFIMGKEVKSLRRLKKAIKFVYLTSLAVWIQAMAAPHVYAQEYAQSSREAMKVAEMQAMEQVDEVMFKIQLICAGICVSVGIVMMMVAGFFRIVGLREEAKKRYMDAIAGVIMVLTAPVVLGVLATVVRGLLRLFPTYGM